MQPPKPTKQVIVVRKDLNMRRGKEDAQSGHAVLSFLTRQMQGCQNAKFHKGFYEYMVRITPAAHDWIEANFAKVTLQVESEEELLEIEKQAKAAGIECHLVTDSGLTEFHGVATNTCLALGPDEVEKIDKITGHLKLR